MSDGAGVLVEDSANYPFGSPRSEFRPRGGRENYQFTQKERDTESGLDYFEARFLSTSISRFIRVDSLATDTTSRIDPQRLAVYAYAGNNPIRFSDPSGNDYVEDLLTEGVRDEQGKGNSIMAGVYAVGVGLNSVVNPMQSIDAAEREARTMLDPNEPTWNRALGGVGAAAWSVIAVADCVGIGKLARLGVSGVEKGLTKVLSTEGASAARGVDKFSRAPKSLMDEMVLDAAKQGKGIKIIDNLGDPEFKGMEKWSYTEKSAAGLRSDVHYVRDPKTGQLMDFKFKHHAETYK